MSATLSAAGRKAQPQPEPQFSVEIFPPKEPADRQRLARSLEDLKPTVPAFVSVTFGAGGTTRDRTIEMVQRIVGETSLEVAAHLTCVGSSRDDVNRMIDLYLEAGVRRVVALRGDPPGGLDVAYSPHPHGYQRTADLVAELARRGMFDVSVAAYPEKHPQSRDLAWDLETLKEKIDAGAQRALTQFFFRNDAFLRFRGEVRARGIATAIVPGILPIVNFKQVCSFAEKCGASVPPEVADRYCGLEDDPQARMELGTEIAARQIADLMGAGETAFHIYCLNRPGLARGVWERALALASADAVS